MLYVCETFTSIQGESTYAGEVCAFVRLSGCNLACSYCDTEYARAPGTQMSVDEICAWVIGRNGRLAEITGGEPLMQGETVDLVRRICEEGRTVLVETNGSVDISSLPEPCVRIVDVKCPGSGAGGSFYMPNLHALGPRDECKFVLSGRADFEWARDFVRKHRLSGICTVIFSPVFGVCAAGDLAEWMVAENTGARLGLQLQKYIWPDGGRGR
jgi:7-carboxy-7-deazaguanine synthase